MKHFLVLLFVASLGAADPFGVRKAEIRLRLEQQDFAAAAEDARSMNRQWPDNVETYQLLAAAELGLGNYEKADQALQWMLDLRLGKADARGYQLLAKFREVTGDVEGAIEVLHLAFGRVQTGEAGNRSLLLAHLARLQLLAGKPALAGKILREADLAMPEVGRVESLRWLALSRTDEAIAALRQLPPKPRYLYALAELTHDPADYAAFLKAAVASPDSANRELVLYWAGVGARPGEALALARRESARRHDVLTQDALAVALAAAGQGEEARKTMRAVLAVGTLDPAIVAHAKQLGLAPE